MTTLQPESVPHLSPEDVLRFVAELQRRLEVAERGRDTASARQRETREALVKAWKERDTLKEALRVELLRSSEQAREIDRLQARRLRELMKASSRDPRDA